MIILTYIKTIVNYEKLHNQLEASTVSVKFSHVGGKASDLGKVFICFTSALDAAETIIVDGIVSAFVDFTTAETLKIYLDESVFPFINDLINRFAAENIALGITQAGKTGHVLGLFEKGYDVHTNGLPISLKGSFDTGSLYESLTIISYIISNPSEISGLTPFVTEAKLTTMAAEITEFLT